MRSNDFILILESIEAELRELLREIMRRNGDHPKVWGFLYSRLGRKLEIACDQLVASLLQVLVKDDLIHGLCKLEVNLRQESGRVR